MTRDRAPRALPGAPAADDADEHLALHGPGGFDPETSPRTVRPTRRRATMLELDASGSPRRGERDRSRTRRRASASSRSDDHPLLGTLVGPDEKFARTTRRCGSTACSSTSRRASSSRSRSTSGSRTRSRAARCSGGLLIVAEPGSRFTVIEEYTSASPELSGYSNAAVEIVVGTAPRSSTSPSRTSRRDLALRLASRHVGRDAELDWVAAASAPGARCGSRTTSPARGDVAGHGRLLRRRRAAPRLRHLPGAHRSQHDVRLRVQGRAPRHRSAVWRGMIRVEEGAQKTNAYQENRNLLLSKTAHADSIPGLEILANDVRCTHGATLEPGRPRAALLPDGPRALARRGRAADRARLLPGRARPDRAPAGARGARRGARGPHPAGVATRRASPRRDCQRASTNRIRTPHDPRRLTTDLLLAKISLLGAGAGGGS